MMKIKLKGSVANDLDRVEDYTGMDKKTIVNIAFFNGIQSMKKGYIPKLTKKENEEAALKTDINVDVTEELKQEIEKYAQKMKVSQNALKGMLIKLECDRILKIFKKYNTSDEAMDLVPLKIKVRVPKIMKGKIYHTSDSLEIKEGQYLQYLLLQGFLFHENNYAPLTLEKDWRLAEAADKLNIDPLKLYSLASFIANHYSYDAELDIDRHISDYLEIRKVKKKQKAKEERNKRKKMKGQEP